MRILIVSFYFPPYNNIGSVRVGKMAHYWMRQGHEVRVISAEKQLIPETLECPISREHVRYVPWWNVRRPIECIVGERREDHVATDAAGGRSSLFRRMLRGLWTLYKSALYLPDMQVGWYRRAVKNTVEVANEFKPDVIYASACPFTSLMVAAKASLITKIPWAAEFRDLWADSHIYQFPEFRRCVDNWMERRTVQSAAGMITVSEPLAETLRQKYRQPVEVVTNGFDPQDLDRTVVYQPESKPMRLVYTGRIAVYKGEMNALPVFQAARAAALTSEDINFVFYGGNDDRMLINAWAVAAGVTDMVTCHEMVPHRDAIRAQQSADALMLLVGCSDREKGTFTGKFFEYVGSRRPILMYGTKKNVAAEWIQENGAGKVCSTADELTSVLKDFAKQHRNGGLASTNIAAANEFTRENQARKAAELLRKIVASRAGQERG